MEYYITTLIAAIFGTLGFGMLFKIKASSLPICCLGGMLTWSVVLVATSLGCGIFTSNLFASIFAIIFSSCLAIKIKLPSTILLTTCVVPLVPGGSLYYTMQSLISKDFEKFYEYGFNTILTALGIAGGIVVGSIIFSAIRKPIPRIISFNRIHYFNERKATESKNFIGIRIHKMNLANKPFQKIIEGKKTVELRLYDEKRKRIKLGDIIEFTNIENTNEKITVKVIGLDIYPNFEELYKHIPACDIGYNSDEEANYKDMEIFYTQEEQDFYSVIAIKFYTIK